MTKDEKIKDIINTCIAKIDDNEQAVYREIAEYAVELGYTPKPIKNVHGLTDAIVFTKNKIGKRICKISPPTPNPSKGKELYKEGKTILALSFFRTPTYSELFHRGVKEEIESLHGNYTGCYGCEICTTGYTYTYIDGQTRVVCGNYKLIELPPISADHVGEIKAMMKAQDDYWLKEIAEKTNQK